MKKLCPIGHSFEKTSDCPTCPKCENAKQSNPEFPKLGKPAHRALANAGILKLKDLGEWTERELLALHGFGPAAIPPLRAAMKKAGVGFRNGGAKK